MRLTLIRTHFSDQGVKGLMVANRHIFHTLELPWRGNVRNISCIPPGIYEMDYVRTRRPFSGRYFSHWLKEVPNRTGILIHSGNWAGDTTKGLKSHSWGCILLGKQAGVLAGQRAVLSSRHAVYEFNTVLESTKNNVLSILEAPD